MNSGGKVAILLQEWPKGKEYYVNEHAYIKLFADGWEIWVPDGFLYKEYTVMETWNLEHYEKL